MRWLCAVLMLAGCAGSEVHERLVAEGIGAATLQTRAVQTDLVTVHVWYPARPDASPAPGKHAVVVFVQGGFVPVDRYAWQAERLVREGYIVLAPEFPEDLAFFFVDAGTAAVNLAKNPPAGSLLDGIVDADRIAVAGHSLGGVVAVKLALAGGLSALVVQASYADPSDVSKLPSLGIPTLSLAGEKDCSAPLQSVRDGFDQFPSPKMLVVMPGQTHYQFTNSEQEDIDRKCIPDVSIDVAHAHVMDAVVAFLRAVFTKTDIADIKLVGSHVEVQ